jgi:hypothetical protein
MAESGDEISQRCIQVIQKKAMIETTMAFLLLDPFTNYNPFLQHP